MKLAYKLLAAPLLTAVAVLGAGQLNSYVANRATDTDHAAFKTQFDDFETLSSTQAQLAQTHTGIYRTVALIGSLDDAKVTAFRADVAQQVAGLKRVAQVLRDSRSDDAESQTQLGRFEEQIDKYSKEADSAIDLASVDPATGIAAMQSADATFADVSKTLQALVARVEATSTSTMENAEARSRNIGRWLTALAVLCAVVAVGLSWWMQRKLSAELARASRIAGEVAAGNLTIEGESRRQDELGDLLRALGTMVTNLRSSIRSVQAATESIGTASAEIATGNLDLSNRTEQTASNLQQAASSMEQLTGTVRQSADSAAQANQLANSAAEVAARGGIVVSQVVATMNDINTSSKRIADIIGVIDGIAFQTNILALNAAVEAARAGEQGRGFAVVASEVRSLAQRSAAAAKEIKGLIGASVEKVEGGSRLVADAGRTMTEIVSSVRRVTDIIGEITAAAAEQSQGIGEVSGSVSQLDQMTQQNAALVEQSAAAAESLKEQAVNLSTVISAFRLTPPAPITADAAMA